MRWLDVFGPPGVGKSTLCDELWPPRSFEWDGKEHPQEWATYMTTVERLMQSVKHHPSYVACRSMTRRSHKKMATVHRMKGDDVYVQTGFAQRGLGIGWRLDDPTEIVEFYAQMPTSLGVVFLTADVETIKKRNVDRGKDRSHMVPKMVRPQEIALKILGVRDVPILEIDTRNSIAESREQLKEFIECVR